VVEHWQLMPGALAVNFLLFSKMSLEFLDCVYRKMYVGIWNNVKSCADGKYIALFLGHCCLQF